VLSLLHTVLIKFFVCTTWTWELIDLVQKIIF